MTERALSFGAVAEAYERYRSGYPPQVVDVLLAHQPADAVEIGAGTGKLTRLVAGRGVPVTAVEPDPEMAGVLRRVTDGQPVEIVISTLEELGPVPPVDLLYAAAAWHWTQPEGRWTRAAALLREGGVFANVGGGRELADPDLEARAESLHREIVGDDRIHGTETETDELAWPGNELLASPYFDQVTEDQVVVEDDWPAERWVGMLGTVSHVLQQPPTKRTELLERIRALLPDTVRVRQDLTVHRARRI